MTPRPGRSRFATALSLTLLLAACDVAVTPPPTAPSSSQSAQGSAGPGQTVGPDATGGPTGTANPGTLATETSLPVPTISDPGEIGMALYDPTKIPDAVMSLLQAMGAEVVGDDGSILLPGADHGVAHLVVTAAEARGWIDMTFDDLVSYERTGGAISISELFHALATSLPAGMTEDQFADNYARAYGESPDALAPLVLIGQPVAPDTRLLRIQSWVLLVDAFVGRASTSGLRRADGAGPAFGRPPGWAAPAARGRLGVASAYQPPLTSQIPGMQDAEWAELMSFLPTLAYRVPFKVKGTGFGHEGHGHLGDTFDRWTDFETPDVVISPSSRRAILFPWATQDPITVTWNSPDKHTLQGHGTINGSLDVPMQTNAAREARISYQLRKEPSNGQGDTVQVVGNIDAVVDQLKLVRATFQLNEAVVPALLLISGTRRASSPMLIEWHEANTIEITLSNPYDVKLEMSAGPTLMKLARTGTDEATGTLARQPDGTYAGAMFGETEGTYDGTSFIGECHDHSSGTQLLYVVARPEPRPGAVDPSIYRLVSGTFGNRGLRLSFYPAAAPTSKSGPFPLCQPTIPFAGGGPDGRPPGDYLPFNDTRWSQPNMGYGIFLPQGPDPLSYKDLSQFQVVTPGGGPLPGIDTGLTWWDITVKVNGELPPP